MVILYTTCLDIKKFLNFAPTVCICVSIWATEWTVIVSVNSVGPCNVDALCFLWGRDWMFKYNLDELGSYAKMSKGFMWSSSYAILILYLIHFLAFYPFSILSLPEGRVGSAWKPSKPSAFVFPYCKVWCYTLLSSPLQFDFSLALQDSKPAISQLL